MSTYELQALLQRVQDETTGLVPVCDAAGHDWVSEGGRCCPKDIRDDCSQAAYRCRTCGAHDFGEPGGPGAKDCKEHCRGEDLAYTGLSLIKVESMTKTTTTREEWTRRFADRLKHVAKLEEDQAMALATIAAAENLANNGDEWLDPEDDADAEMSYWDNDEPEAS